MYDVALLKKLRRENGLTQQQVADLLHMDRSTYTYLELGHTKLNIENLVKLARLYHVSLYELLDEPPPEFPASSGSAGIAPGGGMLFSSLGYEEKRLVLLFRACGGDGRRQLLALAEELTAGPGQSRS